MINYRATIFFLLTLFSGCIQKSEVKPLEEGQYYDLKGLLDSQIAILDSLGFRLQKKAVINKESDTVIISMDDESWEQEFEVFKEADLNKPVLRDRYLIDSLTEQTSNLRILQYLPKDSISSGVISFKIFYLDSLEDVRKLQIKMKENNPIFTSQKIMEMQFADQNRQLILTEFSLAGYHKMILTDSVKFKYSGKVLN